jgi:hypothetical protein
MKPLSYITARIAIGQLLPHKTTFKDTPELKSVFLNNEPEAKFFGPDWRTVFTQVLEYLKTS